MLGPEILSEIERAEPDEVLAFVLRWEEAPDMKALAALETMQERRAAVRRFFADRKAAVLDWAADRQDVEVNDLESSAEALISASKRIWQSLIEDSASPLHDQAVHLLPNFRIYPD